jgi:hypothetical protein
MACVAHAHAHNKRKPQGKKAKLACHAVTARQKNTSTRRPTTRTAIGRAIINIASVLKRFFMA